MPERLAYLVTTVKCVRDFEGVSWAQYDRAYRRHAAQTKDLRWSRVNPTLYSLCFAGKAKRSMLCTHCLSDSHKREQCPDNLFPWLGMFGPPQGLSLAHCSSLHCVPERGVVHTGLRGHRVRRSQFQDRCSHNGHGMWNRRFDHQVAGTEGQFYLPSVHEGVGTGTGFNFTEAGR